MLITILGKRWNLSLVPASALPQTDGRRDCDGYCSDPRQPRKTIAIYNKLNDERTLAILIHEMLHAGDWHRTEEFVEEFAEDVARAATKLGFHRKDCDGE
jgi:hypothetical protein